MSVARKLVTVYRGGGPVAVLKATVRRPFRTIAHWYLFAVWQLFRVTHRHFEPGAPSATPDNSGDDSLKVEDRIQLLLSRHREASFLEIGIGRLPKIERIRCMLDSDIRYVGCDLASVCENHESVLVENGLADPRLRYVGNATGTYSWTLFELLQSGEKFDIVYLDGHHTFYIDLPALLLAHFLLRPGGVMLIDDVTWTLRFMKGQLFTHFNEWKFYRHMYDFGDYDQEQQGIAHIGMIAEHFLKKELGYTVIEEYSSIEWWALKRVG